MDFKGFQRVFFDVLQRPSSNSNCFWIFWISSTEQPSSRQPSASSSTKCVTSTPCPSTFDGRLGQFEVPLGGSSSRRSTWRPVNPLGTLGAKPRLRGHEAGRRQEEPRHLGPLDGCLCTVLHRHHQGEKSAQACHGRSARSSQSARVQRPSTKTSEIQRSYKDAEMHYEQHVGLCGPASKLVQPWPLGWNRSCRGPSMSWVMSCPCDRLEPASRCRMNGTEGKKQRPHRV